MALPQVVYQILKADSDVTDIIGGAVTPRIFPMYTPVKTARPFLIYIFKDLTPTETKTSSREMDLVDFELWHFHENYDGLYDLMEKTRDALVRYHDTIGGERIDSIMFITQFGEFDPENKVYIGKQIYTIRRAQ